MRVPAAFASLLLAALCIPAAAPAQAPYPSRTIRLIIPFPPGGPTDVMGRLIAQDLSGTLGQQVIADNRPGAGGTLAGRVVATAQPDGYTLLLASSGVLAIGPALYGNIGYDPLKSFVPVAMLSEVSYVMIAGPRAPLRFSPMPRRSRERSISAFPTARSRTFWRSPSTCSPAPTSSSCPTRARPMP